MYTVLLVIHSIIVVFLIILVLIQRTDADGLGGLGGGGGNQFLTGRAQANLLTRTTAILAAAFMITSLTLAIIAGRTSSGSILDTKIEQPAPDAALAKEKATGKVVPEEKEHKAPAVPKPE